MAEMSSRPISQTVVYAQATEPTDQRDGVLWVDTGSPGRTVYVYSSDTGSFERVTPSESIRRLQETESFDDVTVEHVGTATSAGAVQLVDSPTVADLGDGSEVTAKSAEAGIEVVPRMDLSEISVRIHPNTSLYTTAYLRLTDGTLVSSQDISSLAAGDWVTFNEPLTAGTRYAVTMDAGGADYNYDHLEQWSGFTVETPMFDVPSGHYNGNSATARIAWGEVKTDTVPESGVATVSWPMPTDVFAWDIVTWQESVSGSGAVSTDVVDSSGNVIGGLSGLSRNGDVSSVSDGTNFSLRFNFSRDAGTTDAATVRYAARRYER